ncbi:MAG: hypothetical protein IPM92_16030 [Saprospiraceae bacterium]|nr:hypothetical protein [Saprospiraceae bacterium]
MKTRIRALFMTFTLAGFVLSALLGLGSIFDRSAVNPNSFKTPNHGKTELKQKLAFNSFKHIKSVSPYADTTAIVTEQLLTYSQTDTAHIVVEEQFVLLEEPKPSEPPLLIDSTDYAFIEMDGIEIDTSDLPK